MSALTRLDAPLLRLGARDHFTLAHSFEGVIAFGGTGSGKTSTTGRYFAEAFCRAGMGGLVLSAKPGERRLWEAYAHATGRSGQLICFDGSGAHRFNVLQWAMAQAAGRGVASNIAHLLTTVLQAASGNAAPAQGGSSEMFWQKAMNEALTHASGLLWAATGSISLDGILQIIQSRPASPHWIDEPPPTPGQTSTNPQRLAAWHWQQTSVMYATLQQAKSQPVHPMNVADYRITENYLTRVLANPDQRVTGNIIATLSAELMPLTMGTLRELFTTTTTVVPEMTHHGAIILMDLPLKEWEAAGALAQQIMKYAFQRAAERRGNVGVPVFLFADEGHLFVSPYDAEFQSTARSSRVATVYLSQNLPAFYERIGGRNAEHTANAFLGNFQTKIFHANNCHTTRQYAADQVGKHLVRRANWGRGEGLNTGTNEGGSDQLGRDAGGAGSRSWGDSEGRNTSLNHGMSEQIDYRMQPGEFAALRTGGTAHRRLVDAVLVKSGTVWKASGTSHLKLILQQTRS